ncbi:hypothetical protein Leryth_014511 [Lithospermum erythrorhizon]|nr:hypothetical protein Leryth_014511 [Lithospermum erythrorhizon]
MIVHICVFNSQLFICIVLFDLVLCIRTINTCFCFVFGLLVLVLVLYSDY